MALEIFLQSFHTKLHLLPLAFELSSLFSDGRRER
jgi:hypothetical protein